MQGQCTELIEQHCDCVCAQESELVSPFFRSEAQELLQVAKKRDLYMARIRSGVCAYALMHKRLRQKLPYGDDQPVSRRTL